MIQTKLIQGANDKPLDKAINEWLAKHTDFEIKDIKFTYQFWDNEAYDNLKALIIYEP